MCVTPSSCLVVVELLIVGVLLYCRILVSFKIEYMYVFLYMKSESSCFFMYISSAWLKDVEITGTEWGSGCSSRKGAWEHDG